MKAKAIDLRTLAQAIAQADWDRAGRSLERLRLDTGTLGPVPSPQAMHELELERGRPLSPTEHAEIIHAYRSELHSLNAELELGQLNARRAARREAQP